jgi:hypothetical protein
VDDTGIEPVTPSMSILCLCSFNFVPTLVQFGYIF